ncbi:MAG: DUF11 domain-containing protein [Planctomycetales bacterium]|nr:DUF11 domain-containing protein [Planctomycetales bacterium]
MQVDTRHRSIQRQLKEIAVFPQKFISSSHRLLATTAMSIVGIAGCGSLSSITGDNLISRHSPLPTQQLDSETSPELAGSTVKGANAQVAPAAYTEAKSETQTLREDSPATESAYVSAASALSSVGLPFRGASCNCSTPVPMGNGYSASGDYCGQTCGQCGAVCNAPEVARNAQEYIFDGGDQGQHAVIRDDWSAAGVEPTDTIAYYETVGGQICVQASNRVPIYAPRFGSVRKVTGLDLAAHAVGTQRMLAPTTPQRFEERSLASSLVLPVAPAGEAQVNLLDAFRENKAGVPVDQILELHRMSEARVPFETFDFFRTGRLEESEIAVLGRILASARTWYVPESLGVLIDGQDVAITRDTMLAEEFYVYETEDKCSLRICKAASHTIADSGDTVSFTIRFDNIGSKPLGNLVILDSLSPRLDYIEDSQQCSLEARFLATDNELGSRRLQWEITEVAPSSGGVISFDCRVR